MIVRLMDIRGGSKVSQISCILHSTCNKNFDGEFGSSFKLSSELNFSTYRTSSERTVTFPHSTLYMVCTLASPEPSVCGGDAVLWF